MKPFSRTFTVCTLLACSVAAAGQNAHRKNIVPAERIKIAQEAHDGERRAEHESRQKYRDPKQTAQQLHLQQKLEERYYFQVCWRHKITHQQLVTILAESLKAAGMPQGGARKL